MGNSQSDESNAVKRQAEGGGNYPVYDLLDLKGGGSLFYITKRAMVKKDYKELDEAIKSKIQPYLYNGGKGKMVPVAQLVFLRNRDRPKSRQLPEIKELGDEAYDYVFEDSELLAKVTQGLDPKTSPHLFRECCWMVEHNSRGSVGETVFHICFLMQTPTHLALARRLLKWYPKLLVDVYLSEDYYGENVLHMSAVAEDPTMVKFLLDQGVNIHERCYGNFFCPDDQKAYRTDSLDHELVDVPIRTNYYGYVAWGEYPLCFAACLGQEECYRLIWSKGANHDLVDTNGNSVTHIMVVYDNMRMFDLAVECGASINIKNNQHMTPLTVAAFLAKQDMFFHIANIEREVYWQIGNVCCSAYPIEQLDSINSATGELNQQSALNLIVFGRLTEHLDLIEGVVVDLLQTKWKSFIKDRFFKQLFVFVCFFLLSCFCFVSRPSAPSHIRSAKGCFIDVNNTDNDVDLLAILENFFNPKDNKEESVTPNSNKESKDLNNVDFTTNNIIATENGLSDFISTMSTTISVTSTSINNFSMPRQQGLSETTNMASTLTSKSGLNITSTINSIVSAEASTKKMDLDTSTMTSLETSTMTILDTSTTTMSPSDTTIITMTTLDTTPSLTTTTTSTLSSPSLTTSKLETTLTPTARVEVTPVSNGVNSPTMTSASTMASRSSTASGRTSTTSGASASPSDSSVLRSKRSATTVQDDECRILNATEAFEMDACYLHSYSSVIAKCRGGCELLLVFVSLLYLLAALREMSFLKPKLFFKTLAMCPSRVIFLLACLLALIAVPFRITCNHHVEDRLALVIMLGIPPYFLFFCRGFKLTGPFVIMIYRMMAADLLRFVTIYFIFVMGFSQAFYIMFQSFENSHDPHPMANPVESIIVSFIMSLGSFAAVWDGLGSTRHTIIGRVHSFLFLAIVSVLLVNLLIAMMGDTYNKIAEIKNEWMRQWARTVLIVERGIPPAERLRQQDLYSERMATGEKALVMKQTMTDEKLEEIKSIIEMKVIHRRNIERRKKKFGYESNSLIGLDLMGVAANVIAPDAINQD